MEQILPIINWLKNNRFWLTCGVLTAAMIATWFVAANQLASEQKKLESDISSKISSAEGIIKTSSEGITEVTAHPNDTTIKGMKQELDEGTKAVLEAWQLRRNKQEQLLTWPKEVIASEEFLQLFEPYDPPETFPVDEKGDRMLDFLAIYKQQIPERMMDICAIIGTDWKHAETDDDGNTPAAQGRGNRDDRGRGGQRGGPPADKPGMGGPGGIPPGGVPPSGMTGRGGGRGSGGARGRRTVAGDEDGDMSVVVKWNEDNQDLWKKKLTTFRGYDGNRLPGNVPSPLQVFMLQQDLWLLEAMFEIIAETNGEGATANDLAAIREIDHIVFGREARTQLGELSFVNKSLAAESEIPKATGTTRGKMGNSRGGPPIGGPPGGGRGRGGPGADSDDPILKKPDKHRSPFHGRYVNAEYVPLTADEVRAVLDPKLAALPDKNLELLVCRRVPVRVAVVMDERKIPDFISKAASATFAFEINQVRMNKHEAGEGIAMSGALGPGTSVDEGGGERQDRGSSIGMGGGAGGALDGGGPASPTGSSSDSERIETRTRYDVKVEFYGIVKIYNPVNSELLSGEKVAEPAQP